MLTGSDACNHPSIKRGSGLRIFSSNHSAGEQVHEKEIPLHGGSSKTESLRSAKDNGSVERKLRSSERDSASSFDNLLISSLVLASMVAATRMATSTTKHISGSTTHTIHPAFDVSGRHHALEGQRIRVRPRHARPYIRNTYCRVIPAPSHAYYDHLQLRHALRKAITPLLAATAGSLPTHNLAAVYFFSIFTFSGMASSPFSPQKDAPRSISAARDGDLHFCETTLNRRNNTR